MPLVRWSDDYSVSIKEIDDQHKKLFDLINDLHDAMKAGKGKDILEKVLKELTAYTEFHFSSEEILMQNCKYPDYKQHKVKHDEFTQKVKEFEQKYLDGSFLLSQEIVQYLIDWLTKHIKESDKQYSMFVIKANFA
ncbi:MAG: bacteriohemerythrin [Ignavibacteriaceae bacterium]|nr:bacteriohemerythrin [Ignavibacteriaceae bacterium]